ncbi:MAG: SDR family NAD(P)-dependent oxidoreductase [Halieaceae bacterium]
MTYFSGKHAVITGAGSGIGRALALQLNSDGCELWLSDVSEAGLTETKALLTRQELACHIERLDVADRSAVHAYADRVAEQAGHIDLLVNNAGVALSDRVDEQNYDDFEWLMNINFWGVVHGTTAFLPLLKRANNGHLVNISSVFGIIGVPTQSAYNASKFAVRGFTEALRQETAGDNISVCCVHPGGIRTSIARNSRGGVADQTPDEREEMFLQFARTSAESAAAKIIRAAEKRKKRLLIGADAYYISIISRLFPVNYTRLLPGIGRLGESDNGDS